MPPLEDQHITFTHSVRSTWPRGPLATITIHNTPVPVYIPLDFLAKSGDNTWELVRHIVQLMVNEKGQLREADGTPLDLNEVPAPIECIFVPIETNEFTWMKGPESATRGKVAADHDGSETGSERTSSTNQSGMRLEVMIRDRGQCIVSNAGGPDASDAAHLVPKARPDVYAEVLGNDFDLDFFHVTMGVVLNKTLHAAYDKYKWSFYYKGSTMFVHVFSTDPILDKYHGHAITSDRFDWRLGGSYLPDARLCDWHYKQCVNMRLRRFSAGLAIRAY